MSMLKRKPKKSILFKKFKEDRLLEDKMAKLKSLENQVVEINETETTKKVSRTVKNVRESNKVTYLKMGLFSKITIAVTNINESVTGSQSVSLLLANYFAKMKKKVCIVTSRPLMQEKSYMIPMIYIK